MIDQTRILDEDVHVSNDEYNPDETINPNETIDFLNKKSRENCKRDNKKEINLLDLQGKVENTSFNDRKIKTKDVISNHSLFNSD